MKKIILFGLLASSVAAHGEPQKVKCELNAHVTTISNKDHHTAKYDIQLSVINLGASQDNDERLLYSTSYPYKKLYIDASGDRQLDVESRMFNRARQHAKLLCKAARKYCSEVTFTQTGDEMRGDYASITLGGQGINFETCK